MKYTVKVTRTSVVTLEVEAASQAEAFAKTHPQGCGDAEALWAALFESEHARFRHTSRTTNVEIGMPIPAQPEEPNA